MKERLGGRLRLAISGGAPLATEIAEFFHAIDILILEGYGLTECTTAATVNRPGALPVRHRRAGAARRRGAHRRRRRDPDPQRARSSPATTRTRRRRARCSTRTAGCTPATSAQIDEDGFLTITDRKKDIIVTAGGKNVAPQNLENALKAHRVVSQALVVGDRRPYVAALITRRPGASRTGCRRTRSSARVQAVVDDVNADRSRFEQIKRFAILPRDFTAEDDEVTPTLKLKRRVVARALRRRDRRALRRASG